MKAAPLALLVAGILLQLNGANAADLAAQCAAAGNDDTVRPYDPTLQTQLLRAYRRLFPDARMPPDRKLLEKETNVRCMDRRLYVCFTGANLPCARMNTARRNKGAEAYCHDNPDAPFVPAYAVGHDTIYAWRCRSGQAELAGRTYEDLDERGFAKRLWTPLSR